LGVAARALRVYMFGQWALFADPVEGDGLVVDGVVVLGVVAVGDGVVVVVIGSIELTSRACDPAETSLRIA
jgi:hypothetical protein